MCASISVFFYMKAPHFFLLRIKLILVSLYN